MTGNVVQWALRKLGVEEWFVGIVQSMCRNAQSHVAFSDGIRGKLLKEDSKIVSKLSQIAKESQKGPK